jgi:hypothetical protein
VEPPDITDWRALPYELEEAILANLSLPKMADLSTTCKRFDHLFHQKLAKEQKARYDLAVAQFGKERLARIADIVHGFIAQLYDPHTGRRLKRYWSLDKAGLLHLRAIPPGAVYGGRTKWSWLMSQDGTLHDEKALRGGKGHGSAHKAGDVRVRVTSSNDPTMLRFDVWFHKGSCVSITAGWARGRCSFSVEPSGNEDVGGVALVQALLSGEFAPIVGEGRPLASVHVSGRNRGLRFAGLATLVAPLLPLAKTYILSVVRGGDMVRERREDGQGDSNAKRIIKLHVIH